MAKAKNEVIAGDYTGRKVKRTANRIFFDRPFYPPVEVNDTTVDQYKVIDQDSEKDLASVFGRGLAGGLLFGPFGMVAGAASAKKATTVLVSIEFKNGDKSLIEIDKTTYKALLSILF